MKRVIAIALVLLGVAFAACYQDDAVLQAPAIAPTKVYITDDPFPFGSVSSVNIYVTKIEATKQDSLSQSASYVTIATPNKSFDLLTLQQGDTAFVGQSTIDAGKYNTVRMTIDVDQSSIKFSGDTTAIVHWPAPGHGALTFVAVVQPQAVTVAAATGATIVIDFDVGRTFVYNNATHDFTVQLGGIRAVNSATAGAIAGHVTRPANGSTAPQPNADVSVYVGGNANLLLATGRTDLNGAYRVGFLPAGSYSVQVEEPDLPQFALMTITDVIVTAGATSNVDVVLTPTDTGGNAHHVSVSGPDSVSPYAAVLLHAFVIDSNNLVSNPLVTWVSRDPSIAIVAPDTPAVVDTVANAIVGGVTVGTTWIVASSGGASDSLLMHVVNPPPPPVGVATVTLTPASLPNLVVGDSVYLVAMLKDSSGNIVSNGTVSWSILSGQDSTIVDIFGYGLQALIRARHTGSTIVQAIEPIHYAHAAATVTVH